MVVDTWIVISVVIVMGALALDRTRAYRVLPFLLSRLRGRSHSAVRVETPGVDSTEPSAVRVHPSDAGEREKEPLNGEGH